MKAELQFLMSATDTDAFLTFAKDHVDSMEDSRFVIGDCEIIFTPSKLIDNALIVGSIMINSGGIDDGLQDQTRANNTYRTLRNWIKKHYYSRLSTWTVGNEAKMGRTRNHWLGPDAKQWKETTGNTEMRLSETSQVMFDIAPEFASMGGVEPKDEKFKPRN